MLFVKKNDIWIIYFLRCRGGWGNIVVYFDVLMIWFVFMNGYFGYLNSISSIK